MRVKSKTGEQRAEKLKTNYSPAKQKDVEREFCAAPRQEGTADENKLT